MPLITLGDSTKLILKIPSKGDTGWADDFKNEFAQKIVDHDHSGGGLGKKIDILNLDKVQQGVSPGNGNALIWDSTDEEFKFLNPATTISPTAFALISSTSSSAGSITTAFSTIIPPAASSIKIETNTDSGVTTGWFTSTGKYVFPTDGYYRLSASVLVSSTREDVEINIKARKTSGGTPTDIKTITRKVQSNVPVGSIIAWSVASSPGDDWLRCDGTAYAESAYPDLSDLLNNTYDTHNGGVAPGAGNFRVPNHSGEFLRDVGSDTLTDVQADATAANGLSVSENFSVSENLSVNSVGNHSHGLSQLKHNTNTTFKQGLYDASLGGASSSYTTDAAGSHSHTLSGTVTLSGGITGVSGDSETRPENTKVAYYIKAKNTTEEQIVLTALVEATALDSLEIMAKGSQSTGIEVNFNDATTAGLTLDLEKLE